MSAKFNLLVTADHPNRIADFTLTSEDGLETLHHRTDFKTISASLLRGMFDLKNHLAFYVEDAAEDLALKEIGVCIAELVLGHEISIRLWESGGQNALRIVLPDLLEGDNSLTAALERVPWELARPTLRHSTLSERHLAIQLVHGSYHLAALPAAIEADEPLRVLFVFASAQGSRPLGARRERRDLVELFQKEIQPHRRVEAHFVTHGVTRQRLRLQIQQNGSYHIVHWSGHGHRNRLELSKPDGSVDLLSGSELLALLREVGGKLPQFFFLSACHSGDFLKINNWADFISVVEGKATPGIGATEQKGFTGTAHALIQGGIPAVVAMRYAIGDDYARELAIEFYRAFLGPGPPNTPAVALAIAKQSLQDPAKEITSRFSVCDHATPVIFGEGRSIKSPLQIDSDTDLIPKGPQYNQFQDLSDGPSYFVGRTWELAGLERKLLQSEEGHETTSVAVITGLGGMGKTALVREFLSLWSGRFQGLLLFQLKSPMTYQGMLRDIHLQLSADESQRYSSHLNEFPSDAIYSPVSSEDPNLEHLELITNNLFRALRNARYLLVLDNFESNLRQPIPSDGVRVGPAWVSQDPGWDFFFSKIQSGLSGSRSRVLITSRRPLAALDEKDAHYIKLGPLPPGEAALFLREHPVLSRMRFGTHSGDREIAIRVLNASRFHPLLMDRLAKLASQPSLREQLLEALNALEKRTEFNNLPALFSGYAAGPEELSYLEDALKTTQEGLLRSVGPVARRLLWTLSLVSESVTLDILAGAWSEVVELFGAGDTLATLKETFQSVQTENDLDTLLQDLVGIGLVSETRVRPNKNSIFLSLHELIRESIDKWMRNFLADKGGVTESEIQLIFAKRFEADFKKYNALNVARAMRAGTRALVLYVQAGAWQPLSLFADDVITNTRDPLQLQSLVAHMRTAAEATPDGVIRWNCNCSLANMLRNIGLLEESIPIYQMALELAAAAAERGGEDSKRIWEDVARISSNKAIALRRSGEMFAAREAYEVAVAASGKADRPKIHTVSYELEMLRLDIIAGHGSEVAEQVEDRLNVMKQWWKNHLAGITDIDAPDPEFLERALIGALDVAEVSDTDRNDWESALNRIEETLHIREYCGHSEFQVAMDRFNRAKILADSPTRFGEAQSELEFCLNIFRKKPEWAAKVIATLAIVLIRQGDLNQAIIQQRRALALCLQLPDPSDRGHCHNALAQYLKKYHYTVSLPEASSHQLAALIYFRVIPLDRHLTKCLCYYFEDFLDCISKGVELQIPTVAELLSQGTFSQLKTWLLERDADLAFLQEEVTSLVNRARREAENNQNQTSES